MTVFDEIKGNRCGIDARSFSNRPFISKTPDLPPQRPLCYCGGDFLRWWCGVGWWTFCCASSMRVRLSIEVKAHTPSHSHTLPQLARGRIQSGQRPCDFPHWPKAAWPTWCNLQNNWPEAVSNLAKGRAISHTGQRPRGLLAAMCKNR